VLAHGVQQSNSNHECAETVGDLANCTANEINLAQASVFDTSLEFCLQGEPVLINKIEAEYGLNTGQRYDPLIWVGIEGNDPKIDDGGRCYVSSAPLDENNVFQNLEGDSDDSCLDIIGITGTIDVTYDGNFNVECQDLDDDDSGLADVKVLVTWVQNTNLNCGPNSPPVEPPEMFAPGAPAKCDNNTISLNIPVLPTATLTLLKDVIGGVAQDTDWTLFADTTVSIMKGDFAVQYSGVEGDDEITNKKVPVGDFVLSESGGPGGYTASGWSCVGGTLSGNTLTLAEDDVAVCTITNQQEMPPPTLTLLKDVTNDNGGNRVDTDWTLTASGPVIRSGTEGSPAVTSAEIPAGVYTLSESGPGGYQAGIWGCTGGGSLNGDQLTLADGDITTCTITNDDIAAQLTVIKNVIKSLSMPAPTV
jgi:hypothetical protein